MGSQVPVCLQDVGQRFHRSAGAVPFANIRAEGQSSPVVLATRQQQKQTSYHNEDPGQSNRLFLLRFSGGERWSVVPEIGFRRPKFSRIRRFRLNFQTLSAGGIQHAAPAGQFHPQSDHLHDALVRRSLLQSVI